MCEPLADRAIDWRADFGRTAMVGLCGAQGSGKSTVAAATARLLAERGFNVVAISLDDFYLGREARGWLAGKTHRLLQVRGPPGTHDVALACAVLDHLRRPGTTPLPAFDKATDERRPKSRWREVEGPVDMVILEGWCVGAVPEPPERLRAPLNALERRDDPSGAWRGYVNRQLGETYQALFGRLDRLVMLAAPGFEVVRGWRAEQEAKLRARTGAGMSDAQVGQFVQHYERLTRWILEEMPGRADWTIRLNADRTPRPAGPATPGS
ncbi:MAG: kinase [Phenylobacterium sp.]|nr:kinase [Phenylobacterium sp.]